MPLRRTTSGSVAKPVVVVPSAVATCASVSGPLTVYVAFDVRVKTVPGTKIDAAS